MEFLNRIIQHDVKKPLPLPDQSVNCCVTSPPYWKLRDYGTATWEGGSAECDHNGKPFTCQKCGAQRVDQQLGMEETPEEYIKNMVAVFREVKRVLKDDGTLWLNIGDSYAGSGKGSNSDGTPPPAKLFSKQGTSRGTVEGFNMPKPKDLVGIPWMLAFALRADGWYLRQDIIWAKPNPMPESVTDRCTKAHEYIFLLSKSSKYYYDADSIKEDFNIECVKRFKREKGKGYG